MSRLFERLVALRELDGDFLRPKYEESLDPNLLPDMERGVERIRRAREKGEKCLIYGDYDVDGVTATTVLYDTLQSVGLTEVETMLPNRFTDGYGMSKKVVQRAVETGVKLVLTVDCGSRNHEIVAELAKDGIDTVVTDHHECGEDLPAAIAVINPKRKDVEVPAELRELAGVGVAFKVAQALVRAGLMKNGQEKWLLDLVTIGTICDSMVLKGENRRLCKYGMLVLEKTRRPGLKELMKNAGVSKLSGDAIGYQIGPRLNAAGRMESAEIALELLMTQQRTMAAKLTRDLGVLNERRKQQQNAAVREIAERGLEEGPVIIEQGKWHEGVLGIIAGRLVEEYKKPAFVLTELDGRLKGSGRSFGEFNLAEALDVCREYIIGGGGHAAACGLSVEIERLGDFRNAMNTYYRGLGLENQERFLGVREDLAVEDFEELSLEFLEELKELEPFGEGNRVPIFLLPGVRINEVSRLGAEGQHLRLVVQDQNGHSMKLMWFSAPEEYLEISAGVVANVWVTVEENEFRGVRTPEGRVVKLRS